MRSKGYKCSNVKCGSCVGHCLCVEPGDSPLSCPDRLVPGQTNADRIRAMSDDELAELLNINRGVCFDSIGGALMWLKDYKE